MTILNATLTTSAAFIAQDDAVTGVAHDGTLVPMASMQKVAVDEVGRIAVGVVGTTGFGDAIRKLVRRGQVRPLLAGRLADSFADLCRQVWWELDSSRAVVVVVGWSDQHPGPFGFALSSEDGFSPVSLKPGSHTFMPVEFPAGPAYDALVPVASRAAAGENVEGLHIAAARLEAEAMISGTSSARSAPPNSLTIVRIDSSGVHERLHPLWVTPSRHRSIGDVLRAPAPTPVSI
jgi:hypothetical protein